MTDSSPNSGALSPIEIIKQKSSLLRGTLVESLADPLTGAIAEDDTALIKFHGSYQQDDRDIRNERRKQKLEPLYSFMVRIRVPGGVCSPAQWLEMDRLATTYANGTIKLTTRQAYQFHGILKRDLKQTIKEINDSLLDTLAACGDVNRNVMCNPNPALSAIHAQVQQWAAALSAHLTPRTGAYHEIWLDKKRVAGGPAEEEPIYGKTYLPRKFKMGIAIPPYNDVDVYSQDFGLIAIAENGQLAGFNVVVGGGMGMTHNVTETYPRLGDVIGFCLPDQVLAVAEEVVKVQRDFGDRTNRAHARLKYTIDDRGVDWFVEELARRLGWTLAPVRTFEFRQNADAYGWMQGTDGHWHRTLFIQNGRVCDTDGYPMMSGLREIARMHQGDFRLTPNQNLMICGVADADKSRVDDLLREYGIEQAQQASAMRLHSMACVAFPTCGLAMAESERYLPGLLDKIDVLLEQYGLTEEPITIRMTGCPNGCARPYIAEIAFVGKAPGIYNMYLGAGFHGERLNRLYKASLKEDQIVAELSGLLKAYAEQRESDEHFGDFVVRTGVVQPVTEGRLVHEGIAES
jgi:sulfite reductase (NADPH) hemoprotein beta-component